MFVPAPRRGSLRVVPGSSRQREVRCTIRRQAPVTAGQCLTRRSIVDPAGLEVPVPSHHHDPLAVLPGVEDEAADHALAALVVAVEQLDVRACGALDRGARLDELLRPRVTERCPASSRWSARGGT